MPKKSSRRAVEEEEDDDVTVISGAGRDVEESGYDSAQESVVAEPEARLRHACAAVYNGKYYAIVTM